MNNKFIYRLGLHMVATLLGLGIALFLLAFIRIGLENVIGKDASDYAIFGLAIIVCCYESWKKAKKNVANPDEE